MGGWRNSFWKSGSAPASKAHWKRRRSPRIPGCSPESRPIQRRVIPLDPVPTYPLPNPPPVDLGDLIARTNAAAHQMMPFVDGYYQSLESSTAQAEAGLKKLAQPLTRTLNARTNGAVKRLTTAVQPVVDMLTSQTQTAQRGMLDFPIPTPTATSVYWAAVRCPDLAGNVVPAERGSPPALGDGWRTYGPYQTAAQAQQAVATYQTYLATDPSCQQDAGAPGGSPPPALDYYWVE